MVKVKKGVTKKTVPRWLSKPQKKPAITATAFRRWIGEMGYNHSTAAEALDVSRTSVIRWSKVGAPKLVLLATQQLAEHGG